MVDWQVGDLAVCVKKMACDCGWTSPSITVGETYRVEGADPDDAWGGEGWLLLAGVSGEGHSCAFFDLESNWFAAEQFRKIRPDEPEACEPEFVTLLKRSKQRVSA